MNDILKYINSDIFSNLRSVLSNNDENYTKNIYVGEVVDNNDPDKNYRIKVKAIGLYDTFDTADIPWAMSINGNINSVGSTQNIPDIGTNVSVVLDNCNIYTPLYIGTFTNNVKNRTTIKKGYSNTTTENYTDKIVLFESNTGDICYFDKTDSELVYINKYGTIVRFIKDGFRITDNFKNTIDLSKDGIQIKDVNKNTLDMSIKGIVIEDSAGNTIDINPITGIKIKTMTGQLLSTSNGSVLPNPNPGPLCAIPICPITGLPHTGNIMTSI